MQFRSHFPLLSTILRSATPELAVRVLVWVKLSCPHHVRFPPVSDHGAVSDARWPPDGLAGHVCMHEAAF
jgi:hypothetical protein